MWCPSCRADVAAELSTDNRRMMCARCQTELGIAAAAMPQLAITLRSTETERDARELLARWSAQNLLDGPAPSVGAGAFAKPNGSTELPITRSERRFDLPQSMAPRPSAPFIAAALAKQESEAVIPLSHGNASRQADSSDERKTRSHRQTDNSRLENSQISTPPIKPLSAVQHPIHAHDQIGDYADLHPVRHRSSWSTIAGQLCAYTGVALLTCGTVLVMWSYFGGPAKFMPTGWLIAAVGQMLLFLGVITLISSGMDQTIAEVSWRIDHLAEEVHHMGTSLDELEREQRKARAKRSWSKRQRTDDGPAREAA